MPNKPMPQKPRPFVLLLSVLVMMAIGLLAGCSVQPKPLPSTPVQGVRLPPLPSYAKQPTTPPECLPTCWDSLTKEREYWLTLLKGEASPEGLANGSTMRP